MWSLNYWGAFAIYVVFALLFGIIAGCVTMTTRANLPAANRDDNAEYSIGEQGPLVGKSIYMAAGSGIPEIKTILSGFVIPHFLDFKVLLLVGFERCIRSTNRRSSFQLRGKQKSVTIGTYDIIVPCTEPIASAVDI
jgi:hypothetical protein